MSTRSKRSRHQRNLKKRTLLHTTEPPAPKLREVSELPKPPSLARLVRGLNADNLERLDEFYAEKVDFEDPLVKLADRNAIKKYTALLFRFGEDVKFDVQSESGDRRQKSVTWILSFKPRTKWLRRATIEIPGMSHFRFENGRAVYHRDYFDVAGSVLRNIPWFGHGARKLKARVGKLAAE
ncbi:MAG: nuclear transport factor 2 family protein [Bdellovibrionota bacterium]